MQIHSVVLYLHQVDKLTSKKYAKTINLLCAGNKACKISSTRGLPQPSLPLRTPLCIPFCGTAMLLQMQLVPKLRCCELN